MDEFQNIFDNVNVKDESTSEMPQAQHLEFPFLGHCDIRAVAYACSGYTH